MEFRSLAEDFDTSTANGKLQLTMMLAFSEWRRNSIRKRSIPGQLKDREKGQFPDRPTGFRLILGYFISISYLANPNTERNQ